MQVPDDTTDLRNLMEIQLLRLDFLCWANRNMLCYIYKQQYGQMVS